VPTTVRAIHKRKVYSFRSLQGSLRPHRDSGGAAMQQIADWLNTLGLGQYAQPFAENDIDPSVLRDLTDHDLEKIGVSLGHRRKILRAIAELDEAGPRPAPSPRTEPERSQPPVMLSDLLASTALSTRLDPEDVRELIGAYHRGCAEQLEKSGGFVARYMG